MAAENGSAPSTARTATTGMSAAERMRRFGPRPEWAHVGVILRPTEVQRGAGYAGILLDALRRDRRRKTTDEGHIVRGGDIVKSVRKILSAHYIATCNDDMSPGRFSPKMPPTQIATKTIVANGQTIAPVIFTDGTAVIFTREHATAGKRAAAWRYPPWVWRLEGAAAFTPPGFEEAPSAASDPSANPGKAARPSAKSRAKSRATTIRGEVTPSLARKNRAQACIRIEWQKTSAKAAQPCSSRTTIWPAPKNEHEEHDAENALAEKDAARLCVKALPTKVESSRFHHARSQAA